MNAQKLLTSTIIAGLLTVGALSTTAHADSQSIETADYSQHSEKMEAKHAKRMEKRMKRMASKLGLNEQQKTQLKALKQNSRNEVEPLKRESRELRKELHQLDPSAADYSAKLAGIANRKAEIARQMTIIKGNDLQQMTQILTPEQLEKFKEMRAKHKGHGKRKHRKNKGE